MSNSASDWAIVLRALVESGGHLRTAQAIRVRQDRETRLAQAEERRERDRAIRPKEGTR